MTAPADERVLILMPSVRDGERTRDALSAAGLHCQVCGDLEELAREMAAGAGVALLAEEHLAADRAEALTGVLRAQPAWSDFPLVLLARASPGNRPDAHRESMNVSLVERPVRIRSLVSVVRAALRSRRHQYEIRRHLAERERQTNALQDKDQRLQFALRSGRLGSWDLDLRTGELSCNERCKQNFGWPADLAFRYADLLARIHPDDLGRVREAMERAVADGTDCDVEHRTLWPDGTTHWLLLRGRATYDGGPLWMSGVSLDITRRKRDEETLRDADRKKDDFIALLAHELRNPLAPIRNGLALLAHGHDPTRNERARRIMERQLGHMVRLIDDLLDVSRINRNKMELRLARMSLAEAVGSAVETVRQAVDDAGHSLEVSLPDEPVYVDGDLTRLAQVFVNLLTNAVKYTEPGGTLRLWAERDGADIVIRVSDTGIGMPADALPTIFDMFSQVERTVERSNGGLGIGLALVRGLVEMHGGTVEAVSDGYRRGSQFTVRLPAMAPDVATPPSPHAIGRNGMPARVLVVDDNRDAAESMGDMLRVFGSVVEVAFDGVEGVECAERFRPDVILMDVGMPRLNGLDATRRIREQPWGRKTAIIALTGWGQDSDRLRSRDAGCDGHLVKPATLDDLTRVLRELEERAG